VPTLFAADPAATLTALASDSARPSYDVNRINKTLLIPESITLAEAVELVSNPREGTATYPFKKLNKSGKKGSTPKKMRPNPLFSPSDPSTSEGIVLLK
jgi:hypothetical protein